LIDSFVSLAQSNKKSLKVQLIKSLEHNKETKQ